MIKRSGAVVACMAILGACLTAAATSAVAAEDAYRVAGKRLEAGSTKAIRASGSTEFTILTKGALGSEIVVTCKKLRFDQALAPLIVGGLPGRSENEKFEFQECSATVAGAKCSAAAVETPKVDNELVVVAAPSSQAGKLAFLFAPASGTLFMTLELTGCGLLGSQEVPLEGTSAALVGTPKTEAVKLTLVWKAAEQITEVEARNGVKQKVGLPHTTIEGEVEVELLSKEKWGVF